MAVALPRLQYRVANPQTHRTNTILQTRTNKKWLTPFFVFGLTHAPIWAEGLDRKNTVIGKYREWQPHRTTCSLAQAWHTSRRQFSPIRKFSIFALKI